jgi:hypothetical protein
MKTALILSLLEGLAKRNKLYLLKNPEIQKSYELLFLKGRIEDVRHLNKLTNISPSNDSIQKAYQLLLKKGWVKAIENVQKGTHVPPKFDNTEIHIAYRSFIADGLTEHVKVLNRITRTSPRKNDIEFGINKLLKKGRIDSIIEFRKTISFPKDRADLSFLIALHQGKFKKAANIYYSNSTIIGMKLPGALAILNKYFM